MRFLNYRAWQDTERPDADPDDFEAVDDDEAEAEYWKATDEAIEMVRDGVWQ